MFNYYLKLIQFIHWIGNILITLFIRTSGLANTNYNNLSVLIYQAIIFSINSSVQKTVKCKCDASLSGRILWYRLKLCLLQLQLQLSLTKNFNHLYTWSCFMIFRQLRLIPFFGGGFYAADRHSCHMVPIHWNSRCTSNLCIVCHSCNCYVMNLWIKKNIFMFVAQNTYE